METVLNLHNTYAVGFFFMQNAPVLSWQQVSFDFVRLILISSHAAVFV